MTTRRSLWRSLPWPTSLETTVISGSTGWVKEVHESLGGVEFCTSIFQTTSLIVSSFIPFSCQSLLWTSYLKLKVQLVCHPPPPTYTTTFSGLTSRTVDDKHYIGKSFSDSESGCRAQCNSKDDCAFVNTYRNVPKGADDSSRWVANLGTWQFNLKS